MLVECSARLSANSLHPARSRQAPALCPGGNTAQSRGPFEKQHHWGNLRCPLSCIRADSGCKLIGRDAWRWQAEEQGRLQCEVGTHCRADCLLDGPGCRVPRVRPQLLTCLGQQVGRSGRD